MPSDTAAITDQLAPSAQNVSWGWVNPWTIGTAVIAGLAIMPIAAIVWIAAAPGEAIWSHLASTVLPGWNRSALVSGFSC